MAKLPAIQFYPGDWLRDPIAYCSLAAQGLWLRMMFIMHDSERYGYLVQNGRIIPSKELAKRTGCDSLEQYDSLLTELDSVGVPSRTRENIIYSRRMVRDEQNRSANRLRQAEFRKSNHDNKNVTVVSQTCHNDVTGSSSSASSSSSPSKIKQKASPSSYREPPPEEAVQLAGELKAFILGNNSSAKITDSQIATWARDADLMLRKDERTITEIRAVMWFCQKDPFWLQNILSMSKLREKYDQLALKMRNNGGQKLSPGQRTLQNFIEARRDADEGSGDVQ